MDAGKTRWIARGQSEASPRLRQSRPRPYRGANYRPYRIRRGVRLFGVFGIVCFLLALLVARAAIDIHETFLQGMFQVLMLIIIGAVSIVITFAGLKGVFATKASVINGGPK